MTHRDTWPAGARLRPRGAGQLLSQEPCRDSGSACLSPLGQVSSRVDRWLSSLTTQEASCGGGAARARRWGWEAAATQRHSRPLPRPCSRSSGGETSAPGAAGLAAGLAGPFRQPSAWSQGFSLCASLSPSPLIRMPVTSNQGPV